MAFYREESDADWESDSVYERPRIQNGGIFPNSWQRRQQNAEQRRAVRQNAGNVLEKNNLKIIVRAFA